ETLRTLDTLSLEDRPLSDHEIWYENWKEGKESGEFSSEKKNEPIKIETLQDLWRKEIPKRESFLGDGLIAREDIIVFSGPQKKGKSILSLNLGLRLAKGENWFSWSVPKPLRVGIIQQEIPEGALKERLEKMLEPEAQNVEFLSRIP